MTTRTTSLDELAIIHDCTLHEAIYTPAEHGRTLRLAISCPHDLGYAPWDGKAFVLVVKDIAVMNHLVFDVAGRDDIDAINPGVSAALQAETVAGRRIGLRFPDLEFSISFHTGSALEIICGSLEIEIDN